MTMPPVLTDMPQPSWIDALPPRARPYARLMRLDRPIGTWLLLLPCWWGVALASPLFPHLGYMLLFAVGSVVMRGAGCVVNDIYDRKLDRAVDRTRARPLANGEVSVPQALAFLAALLAIGLSILLVFNQATVIAGALSLVLVFLYPLMKRITWWPQAFLGLTFNWGALMGSTAVTGHITFPCLIAYLAGGAWTLAYDTIYAHQDIRDDERVGIKSTARLFGGASLVWISLFYAAAVLLLMLAGWAAGLGRAFHWGMMAAACFALVQLALWRMNDPANCLRRFQSNRDFGLIVWAAIVLGKML